jgi:hypothetical protein
VIEDLTAQVIRLDSLLLRGYLDRSIVTKGVLRDNALNLSWSYHLMSQYLDGLNLSSADRDRPRRTPRIDGEDSLSKRTLSR